MVVCLRPSLHNPGPVSRYLTACEVAVDGERLDPALVELVNATPGEAGVPVHAASLGPESGFCIRRRQSAELRLPVGVETDGSRVTVTLGLAGVTTTTLSVDALVGDR